MSASEAYLSRVEAQRWQVRRAREHLDQAEADFHVAADAWDEAGHPQDGELLYAYKRAAVWLSHVAATHLSAVDSQDRMLARLFSSDEGVG
jgi:hypothetical protein